MSLRSQARSNLIVLAAPKPLEPEPWMLAFFRTYRRWFGVLPFVFKISDRRQR